VYSIAGRLSYSRELARYQVAIARLKSDSISERKIKWLEERLRNRDATTAELMTEHLALKKVYLGRSRD
jgi:hypothetical protein